MLGVKFQQHFGSISDCCGLTAITEHPPIKTVLMYMESKSQLCSSSTALWGGYTRGLWKNQPNHQGLSEQLYSQKISFMDCKSKNEFYFLFLQTCQWNKSLHLPDCFQIKSSLPAKADSSCLLPRGMSLNNWSQSGVPLQS